MIGPDDPNPDQRRCFADVVASPEIFEWRSRVRSDSSTSTVSVWVRYECTIGGLLFSNDPSSEVDGPLPFIDDSGCSTDDTGPSADGGVDGPVIYAAPSNSDPADRAALVWAAGTRWDPVASEVILPNDVRAPIGAAIFAGGGVVVIQCPVDIAP